ncbi:hypothetical protein GCM10023352_04050 [Rothia endophytica]|uniref:Uncharacterized protein n=1 Tax=Rothia endophytica TaxID=1324766 RepID=A0ABP9B419_9MICC
MVASPDATREATSAEKNGSPPHLTGIVSAGPFAGSASYMLATIELEKKRATGNTTVRGW